MSKKTIQNIVDKAKQVILKKNEEIVFLKTGLKAAMGGKEPILLKMPNDIKIENLPDVQKVRIENYKEIQDVKILNIEDLKAEVKMPEIQNVRVIDADAKNLTSKWVPELITHSIKAIAKMISDVTSKGILIKTDPEDKLSPQAVIIVDTRGRPVDLAKLGGGAMLVPSMGPTGGGVKKPATIIGSGRTVVSVAGTAVKIQNTSQVCREITITALDSNTDAIFVGGSDVLATAGSEKGLLLTPTGSVTIDIDDVSKIYVDARESGDAVTYTYVR